MDLRSRASSIGALADDTRRALYELVVGAQEPVGREQAATALGLPLRTAAFHLDRLAEEGLLEVEFRRLTGRTGPGAGRPSKLYRRAAAEVAVSLPERSYDLVGGILAEAVERSIAGEPLERALGVVAHERGAEHSRGMPCPEPLEGLSEALRTQGYEPRVEDEELILANCPFDVLAKEHTALVCGLNLSYVEGVTEGLGCTADVEAALQPCPGRCCVVARRRGAQPSA